MKTLMLVLVMLVALGQSGCAFFGGAAVGAGGTGAAYEYNAYRQMQQLEEDHKAERISRREYEERKNRSRLDRLFTNSSQASLLVASFIRTNQ